MNYRTLGRTGLGVSEVGMGTWQLAGYDDNVSVSDGRKLSKELMEKLKDHAWERNFYVDFDPSMEKDGYIEK